MTINKNYKYESLVSFDAPIIPGVGLGNIKLSNSLDSMKDWLIFNFFSENKDNIRAEAFNGIYLSYTVSETVEIIINIVDARIEKIGCKIGYKGTFINIKPGSFIYELIYSREDVYLDNGFLLLKKNPGIEIDIPANYEDIEDIRELPNFAIERIFVTTSPLWVKSHHSPL
jgi:hypothetical protein